MRAVPVLEAAGRPGGGGGGGCATATAGRDAVTVLACKVREACDSNERPKFSVVKIFICYTIRASTP